MLILIQAESGIALPNEAHTHHECSRVHDLLLDELLPEKPHHVVVPAPRGGSVSGHLIRQHLINRVKTIGDGNIGFVSHKVPRREEQRLPALPTLRAPRNLPTPNQYRSIKQRDLALSTRQRKA